MDIHETYNSLLDGKQIELEVREKDSSSTVKALCELTIDGLSIISVLKSSSPIILGINNINLELHTNLPNGSIKLNVVASNIGTYELKGSVSEMIFQTNDKLVNTISFDMAGAQGSPFIRNNYSWSNTHNIESDTITISYQFIDNKITAIFSKPIDRQSSLYTEVEKLVNDEIFVINLAYSFCRSSKVEWVMKKEFYEKNIVCSRYITSTAPADFSNQVNPMRTDNQLWVKFINHIIEKKLSKKDMLDNGIFQAVSNLCWAGAIDEWTLIKHAAALEGLCKTQTIDVMNEKKYKKIRDTAIESLAQSAICHEIKKEQSEQIIKNIYNNQRIINGYTTKWYIEKCLKDYDLDEFCTRNILKINNAINMRNTVVHTGWSDKWKTNLIDHITILRNTIYLIVLSRLEFTGEFYLFGKNKKTSLEALNCTEK